MTSSSGNGERDPAVPGPWPGEEGRGLPLVGRDGLMAHLDNVLLHPPVGVLLVEWDPVPGLRVGSPQGAAYDPMMTAVLTESRPDDLIVSGGPGLLALVRPSMTGPAEAEGLARRVAERVRPSGDRRNDPAPTWAIGVAVSHHSDSADDLLCYAEHALSDAQLLGGDQIVTFDDVDRLLLAPRPQSGSGEAGDPA